jgi:hypothetical protein
MIDIGYYELKRNAKVDRKRKYVALSSAPHTELDSAASV